MKNGLTKFVLLEDYGGDYTLKLDNVETQKHIYENIDDYQMVSQMECTIPTDLLKTQIERHINEIIKLEDENKNQKEEIERLNTTIKEIKNEHNILDVHSSKKIESLKKELDALLAWQWDLQESHNNKVSYLEEEIHNLENKLSVHLEEQKSNVHLHEVKGGE